jgi:hypothetical protein
LRGDRLVGLKIGQLWLVDKSAFEDCLKKTFQNKIDDLVSNNFFVLLFTSGILARHIYVGLFELHVVNMSIFGTESGGCRM